MAGIAQGMTLLDAAGNPISSQLVPAPGGQQNAFQAQLLLFGSVLSADNPLPVAEEIVGSQISASNTGAAAAAVTATLPGVAAKTTYIRGFVVSTTNPAAAVSGVVTVTGTIGGTLNFQIVESITQGGLLIISFGNAGLAASAQNTAIVVTLPAIATGGAGAVSAWGVQI